MKAARTIMYFVKIMYNNYNYVSFQKGYEMAQILEETTNGK